MRAETLKHASAVRTMHANGLPQRAIAEALNLGVSTVNRLINMPDSELYPENAIDKLRRRMREHDEHLIEIGLLESNYRGWQQ
jgi:hypothetical protein